MADIEDTEPKSGTQTGQTIPKYMVRRSINELARNTRHYMDLIDFDYNKILDGQTFVAEQERFSEEIKRQQGMSESKGRVAIIGGGLAGYVAAYELIRCGVNVDIYEARSELNQNNDTSYGRLYSRSISAPKNPSNGMGTMGPSESGTCDKDYFIAEMGAMRFPETSICLWKYLAKVLPQLSNRNFGVDDQLAPFPNPGVVPTAILLDGEIHTVQEGVKNNPEKIAAIANKVTNFLKNLRYSVSVPESGLQPGSGNEGRTRNVTITFENVQGILAGSQNTDPLGGQGLSAIDKNIVEEFFSKVLMDYETQDFATVLKTPVSRGGIGLTQREFEIFYYLGLGTGGFGPLYPIGFVELIRLLAWNFDIEFQLPGRSTDIAQIFADACSPAQYMDEMQEANRNLFGALSKRDGITVEGVSYSQGRNNVIVQWKDAKETYDYVIVATSHRVYQTLLNLDARGQHSLDQENVFATEPKLPYRFASGLDTLAYSMKATHTLASSKLFCTSPVPWHGDLGKWWPKVGEAPVKAILSDTLAMQSYILVNEPGDGEAVPQNANILLSYMWEDESHKNLANREYPITDPTDIQDKARQRSRSWVNRVARSYNNYQRASVGNLTDAEKQGGQNDEEQNQNIVNFSFGSILLDEVLEKGYQSLDIFWEEEAYIHTAFKLPHPGETNLTTALAFQFQHIKDEAAQTYKYNRVILAGESCSYSGGWVEGALTSAIHAAAAVLRAYNYAPLRPEVEKLFSRPSRYTKYLPGFKGGRFLLKKDNSVSSFTNTVKNPDLNNREAVIPIVEQPSFIRRGFSRSNLTYTNCLFRNKRNVFAYTKTRSSEPRNLVANTIRIYDLAGNSGRMIWSNEQQPKRINESDEEIWEDIVEYQGANYLFSWSTVERMLRMQKFTHNPESPEQLFMFEEERVIARDFPDPPRIVVYRGSIYVVTSSKTRKSTNLASRNTLVNGTLSIYRVNFDDDNNVTLPQIATRDLPYFSTPSPIVYRDQLYLIGSERDLRQTQSAGALRITRLDGGVGEGAASITDVTRKATRHPLHSDIHPVVFGDELHIYAKNKDRTGTLFYRITHIDEDGIDDSNIFMNRRPETAVIIDALEL